MTTKLIGLFGFTLLVGCTGEPSATALPAAVPVSNASYGGTPDFVVKVRKTPDIGPAVESLVPMVVGKQSVWAQDGMQLEFQVQADGKLNYRFSDETGVRTGEADPSTVGQLSVLAAQLRITVNPSSSARMLPDGCSCGSPVCHDCCIKSPLCCECCGTGCSGACANCGDI